MRDRGRAGMLRRRFVGAAATAGLGMLVAPRKALAADATVVEVRGDAARVTIPRSAILALELRIS